MVTVPSGAIATKTFGLSWMPWGIAAAPYFLRLVGGLARARQPDVSTRPVSGRP